MNTPPHRIAQACYQRQNWIFDVDDTLYDNAQCGLFEQIKVKITAYVASLLGLALDDAEKLQHHYYLEHGTTLCGLMHHHQVDPLHFLDYVHDVDYGVVQPCQDLKNSLQSLDELGRALYIYSNADIKHVRKVLRQLEVDHLFQDSQIFDIIRADYCPKPTYQSLQRLLNATNIDANNSVFIDDLPQNLEQPRKAGMLALQLNRQEAGANEFQTNSVAYSVAAALKSAGG